MIIDFKTSKQSSSLQRQAFFLIYSTMVVLTGILSLTYKHVWSTNIDVTKWKKLKRESRKKDEQCRSTQGHVPPKTKNRETASGKSLGLRGLLPCDFKFEPFSC
jgi:hypothetical protein